jgi:hypothetical protein
MTATATLLLSVSLMAQAPARDGARAAATGTAAIAGVVSTDTQPSRPLRRAMVSLVFADNNPENQVRRTTVTDDAGKFQFTGLPAGRYLVSASRAGWIAMSYGAKRPGRQGTRLAIEAGQVATIAMRLPRNAVITGVVLDSTGQPVPLLNVRAMRYASINGERRLVSAGITRGPDERGAYRIYGLPAGDYYVAADVRANPFSDGRELHLTTDVDVQQAARAVRQGSALTGGPAAIDTSMPRSVGFVPVYYPGTPAPAQATLLTLRAGEERSGVDFPLTLAPTARVEGTVSSPDGPLPPNTSVDLVQNDRGSTGTVFEGFRTTRAGPDGQFQFADVAPGAYTVAARASAPLPPGTPRGAGSAPILWATTDIAVEGQPVSGVSLTLQPGLTITGSVRFDGTSPVPDNLSGLRVNLAPATSSQVAISAGAATVDATGRFTIPGVSPGRYRVTATFTTARAWTYRSAVLGGADVVDGPFEVRGPVSDLVVTFTDRVAELDGKVIAASGTPSPDTFVVLFPADPAAWYPLSRRIRTVGIGTDSGYSFKGLIPGEYLLATMEDLELGEQFDPALLQRLVPSAIKISIAEGEKKVQDVRAGGG